MRRLAAASHHRPRRKKETSVFLIKLKGGKKEKKGKDQTKEKRRKREETGKKKMRCSSSQRGGEEEEIGSASSPWRRKREFVLGKGGKKKGEGRKKVFKGNVTPSASFRVRQTAQKKGSPVFVPSLWERRGKERRIASGKEKDKGRPHRLDPSAVDGRDPRQKNSNLSTDISEKEKEKKGGKVQARKKNTKGKRGFILLSVVDRSSVAAMSVEEGDPPISHLGIW